MEKHEVVNQKGKMCTFEYNKSANMLTIGFAGFLATKDGGEEFGKRYAEITGKLIKSKTTLLLDVRELKPFQQEFLDNLAGLYMDYATFKKVYWINSSTSLTNSQTTRLLNKLGIIDKFAFVDSLSDVK